MVLCLAFAALASQVAEDGFVHVPAGTYHLGKAGMLDNLPRNVHLEGFEISRFDVTNREFANFVSASHYVTDAERHHDAMVFKPGLPEFRWIQDHSGQWRFPNGKSRGGLEGKWDHPVTSISFRDAEAYCRWAHVRLPTLDEWEAAARAGTRSDYFFGNSVAEIGKFANIWHGRDHLKADYSDGYMYTSPVGKFLPNPWGLYDIYGNVFQFCNGHLPGDRSSGVAHARGGSWWCSTHSCCFFNSADVGTVNPHASFSNQGFRVVRISTAQVPKN